MTDEFEVAFLDEICSIARLIDRSAIGRVAAKLAWIRASAGRVFILGVGGGAGNATHAVCDLRNLAGLDAQAPTDNPATLTALINDSSWRTAVGQWLLGSRICSNDAVMVFSVGGGSENPPVSVNLVEALRVAKREGAFICGVVGPDGGETARLADECVLVPVDNRSFRTTHTEIFQSVVWHMLIMHPLLAQTAPRWESLCP